jgi:hypothetical protein
MRKAVKHRSRRSKGPTQGGNGSNGPQEPNETLKNGGGPDPVGPGGERRKQTTEEAALTAKNYRLAKELVSTKIHIYFLIRPANAKYEISVFRQKTRPGGEFYRVGTAVRVYCRSR